jgi:hypothetical protein
VQEEDFNPDVEDDEWAPDVSGRRAGAAYRFGTKASWAVGLFWGWAERLPAAFFYNFLFFSFSFSVFLFVS